jgi:restriction endonuclease S subunit
MKSEAREVARPTLNLEQLRTIPLPLPPNEEQKEIIRRGEKLLPLPIK